MSTTNDQPIPSNTPIIVGVGQITERVCENLAEASSHADLAAQACERALNDTGVLNLARNIDTMVTVRTFADSGSLGSCPFGMSDNLPRAISQRIGANPERAIYGVLGGETPQKLTAEFCERLMNRESEDTPTPYRMIMITGAEVIATIRAAKRQGVTLDWHEVTGGQLEDRGITGGYALFGEEEIRHGMSNAMPYYALMENARRANLKLGRDAYNPQMGQIFEHYSQIAATNPLSFFPKAMSASELITLTPSNPMLMAPYPRNLIAKDGVNQAAAALLTTVGEARRLGIAREKWVFLHGYADTQEQPFLQRPDLGDSPAMRSSLLNALKHAERTIDDIQHMDLYSCFPIVPILARDVLELTEGDPRALTTTGGLPFFGGPGNNYTLHGIASLVERLRDDPGSYGLVYGNGGWMSKHSTGIYSTAPPNTPLHPNHNEALQQELDQQPHALTNATPQGRATLETYTVAYRQQEPEYALVVARLQATGERFLALSYQPGSIEYLVQRDPLGESLNVSHDISGNIFHFSEQPANTC